MPRPKRKCVGFGPYEGTCQNLAGTPWSPYWCPRCDELRKAHIAAQLKTLVNGVKDDYPRINEQWRQKLASGDVNGPY